MKLYILFAVLISFFMLLSTVRAEEMVLTCQTNDRSVPEHMRQFEVAELDKHASSEAYLPHLDARQYDPSVTDENGNLIISMHNGCDNYFEMTVFPSSFKDLLEGKESSMMIYLEYAIPDYEKKTTFFFCWPKKA